MTLAEFREVAQRGIDRGAAYYGQYFFDHRDNTIYRVTRVLNENVIFSEDRWTDEHPNWERHFFRAMQDPSTLHVPRDDREDSFSRSNPATPLGRKTKRGTNENS